MAGSLEPGLQAQFWAVAKPLHHDLKVGSREKEPTWKNMSTEPQSHASYIFQSSQQFHQAEMSHSDIGSYGAILIQTTIEVAAGEDYRLLLLLGNLHYIYYHAS